MTQEMLRTFLECFKALKSLEYVWDYLGDCKHEIFHAITNIPEFHNNLGKLVVSTKRKNAKFPIFRNLRNFSALKVLSIDLSSALGVREEHMVQDAEGVSSKRRVYPAAHLQDFLGGLQSALDELTLTKCRNLHS